MRFEKRKSWRKFALQMYEFWGEMGMEKRKKTQKIAKKMAPKFQIFAEGTYMRLRNRPERPPSKLSTRNGANTESRDAI